MLTLSIVYEISLREDPFYIMLIMFCEILSELVLMLATISEIIVASVLALEATAISRLSRLIRLSWIFYLLLAASLLFITVVDELKPIL